MDGRSETSTSYEMRNSSTEPHLSQANRSIVERLNGGTQEPQGNAWAFWLLGLLNNSGKHSC